MDAAAVVPAAQFDSLGGGVAGVLDRVVDEIPEHLHERVALEAHGRRIRVDVQAEIESLLVHMRSQQLGHLPHDRCHGAGHERYVARALLEARELEHVVDESAEALRLDGDVPVVLVALGLRRHQAVAQHLAVHADRRERRLQLVGDRGDEVAAPFGKAHHHRHHAVQRSKAEHAGGQ